MKLINSIFRYFIYILFRPLWYLENFVPRKKNIWIFGAWFGQKYSDNSKYLFEYTVNHEKNITAIWITKNVILYNRLRKSNFNVCLSYSIKGMYYTLIAGYAFLTNGEVDVNKYLLNGCKQIWLWHGMPLKKILKCDDAYQKSSLKKRKIQEILNPYSTLNPYATITSSNFFVPFLKESFGLDEKSIWRTGLPRCDAFFSKKKEPYINDLREKFSKSKIFIYMPTFRMQSTREGEKISLFDEKYKFQKEEFSNFLEENNIVFIFKPHFVDSGITIDVVSRRFIYLYDNMYEDLYCLLNSVDALLTDYSSVYFDFLPSGKPTFLLPFDYKDYIKNSRSHFFDMYKEINSQICKDWTDFYRQVNNKYKNNTSDIKKFGEFLDGNSSKKIIDNILRN